jgi:hypothetical protein
VVGRAPLLDAVEGLDLDALGDRAGREHEVEPALLPRWVLRLGVVGRDAVRALGELGRLDLQPQHARGLAGAQLNR